MMNKSILLIGMLVLVLINACTSEQEQEFRDKYEDDIREEVADIAKTEISRDKNITEALKVVPTLNIPAINRSFNTSLFDFEVLEEVEDAEEAPLKQMEQEFRETFRGNESKPGYWEASDALYAAYDKIQSMWRERRSEVSLQASLHSAWTNWDEFVDLYENHNVSHAALELKKLEIESQFK